MDKLTEWLTKPFLEDVNVPVNIGDTIEIGYGEKNLKTLIVKKTTN